MWYNEIVSRFKLTIPQFLIVPAFLAFQIVSRPWMLCMAGPCEMQRCELAKAEQQLCVSVNEVPEPDGCCAKGQKETTPSKASSCGGCGEWDAAPAKIDFHCAMDDATNTECAPGGCEEPAKECPFAETTCSPCLPIPVFAETSVKFGTRLTYDQTFILMGHASRALAEGDQFRGFLHAHSPPVFKPARAGPQICTKNCSWLI